MNLEHIAEAMAARAIDEISFDEVKDTLRFYYDNHSEADARKVMHLLMDIDVVLAKGPRYEHSHNQYLN